MKTIAHRDPATGLLRQLIESPQLAAQVQALPVDGFAALVREIGVEDAGEIVALATTEQLVAAFDEDLFANDAPGEREVFDHRRFAVWLEVLLEAGDAAAARRLAELSEDFLAHAIGRLAVVLDAEALRLRMDEAPAGGAAVDKALESALAEELEGYLLVARGEDGWDALLGVVVALDRDHRALLERVLDRCAHAEAEQLDDLVALAETLSAGETLAEDVEAAREERRARRGFVEPRAARAFLLLARKPAGDRPSRDANTAGYFRELERREPDRGAAASTRGGDDQPTAPARVARALPAASGLPAAPPRTLLLWQRLASEAPETFEVRLRELAYLANVLRAGASRGDRPVRPAEAAEAALATVTDGAIRVVMAQGGAAAEDAIVGALHDHPADWLFRKACSARIAAGHPDGIVWAREDATSNGDR